MPAGSMLVSCNLHDHSVYHRLQRPKNIALNIKCLVQFIQDKLNSVSCSAYIVKKMEKFKDTWFVKPKILEEEYPRLTKIQNRKPDCVHNIVVNPSGSS